MDGTISATGCSNTDIFRQYIKNHFVKFLPTRQPGQHLLVLFDGHISHIAIDINDWFEAKNIREKSTPLRDGTEFHKAIHK
ncbi:hypothetical protein KUTeg_020122 [Tegillarca granosa]|uniref:DDE-1 domain-containing protein n=1 Tax=Tegillarca granosa TaxID=220873 RepID=A0ABQ9ECB5_TEGGR|nr:hypothetical protein KUTeg_020122 [Tegillarca granosa]